MAQLHSIIGSILRDIISAQHEANLYSRSLVEAYGKEGKVRDFQLPSVAISDMELDLKYGVLNTEAKAEEYNIRYGKLDATDEECINAAKLACADEAIAAKPDGYNTVVERGGANFSGGQKQRICIARALLKKPKVLILDDSTSAVDTVTEGKIQKAFAECIPETTKIIIAQRISSVKHADRIIVMEDGMINGIGSHEELMNTNEIYKSIVAVQTEGHGDFDRTEV